jgi:hypothetical protein
MKTIEDVVYHEVSHAVMMLNYGMSPIKIVIAESGGDSGGAAGVIQPSVSGCGKPSSDAWGIISLAGMCCDTKRNGREPTIDEFTGRSYIEDADTFVELSRPAEFKRLLKVCRYEVRRRWSHICQISEAILAAYKQGNRVVAIENNIIEVQFVSRTADYDLEAA